VGFLERLGERIASFVDDVALPDELRERVELAAALADRGDFEAAERELEAVVELRPEFGRAWRVLGIVRWKRGDADGAVDALERAADPEALVALADLHRTRGNTDAAADALRRALAEAPEGAIAGEIYRALGELHFAAGRYDKAVRELRKAAATADAPEIHALLGQAWYALGDKERALAALRRAVGGGSSASASTSASASAPAFAFAANVSPAAYATLGECALAAGEREEAARAFRRAGELPQAQIGLGRIALLDGDLRTAHEQALRALGSDAKSADAQRLLADVHERAGNLEAAIEIRQRLGDIAADDPLATAIRRVAAEPPFEAPADLHGLLRATHRLFLAQSEFGALAPEVARILESLDRPLLVAVMGEFNTGKSTFVNALLGEPVAPMGITPTTATINILKYGAQPAGRVIYRDDRTREIPWADVPQLLRNVNPDEARAIRVVEVLYPAEALQRVNVVDTPGLNSLIPEHEETAREFIAQADAVIWLFAVGQAGKHTEADALARVRAESKHVLGVLNKIDRATPAEVDEVLRFLTQSFELEAIAPVSAKDALAGKGGRFDELRAVLEARFFSRAREIQRTAARERLVRLLDKARAALPPAPVPRDDARRQIDGRARRFATHFLPQERTRVRTQAETAYRAAAREVLEFARPRTWVFGSNEADPADRDFLLDVLEHAIDEIAAGSRARAEAELGAPLERVYEPLRAYARGFLRGGRVDAFFTRALPKMELAENTIFRALMTDAPDLEEWLVQPLLHAAAAHFAAERAALARAERADRAAALEAEHRLAKPLSVLSSRASDILTTT
jgi:tetratricopeptide (TPR) repeat protein